jgi:hypothetical protein
VEVGIWIEQILPPGMAPAGTAQNGMPAPPPQPMPAPGGTPAAPGTPGAPAAVNTNTITMICRAVSLTAVDTSANPSIAYAVETEIKNSPMVDAQATQLSPNISLDDPNGTFTFTVNVTPKNPLNF